MTTRELKIRAFEDLHNIANGVLKLDYDDLEFLLLSLDFAIKFIDTKKQSFVVKKNSVGIYTKTCLGCGKAQEGFRGLTNEKCQFCGVRFNRNIQKMEG